MFVRPWDFSLLRRYESPEGDGNGGAGATGPAGPGATGPTGATGPGFTMTPEIEAEINRRAAAARKEGQTAAEAAIAAAKKKADDDAELERQVKAGEFDAVKTTLETERDGFKTRAETAEQQIDAYKKVIGPVIEERLKAVTDADAETAKVFPKDADPLAQLDWLNSPLVRRVVDLASQGATTTRGFPVTPKPIGTNPPSIEQTRRELAALRHQRLRT